MCYEEIRNRQVRTRKPTHCCWCAESIEKGDLAQYRVYNNESGVRIEGLEVDVVTHWMALPPPPTEGVNTWITEAFLEKLKKEGV